MGRLKHLQQGLRSFGHIPNTKISRANEAYGFGGAEYWWDAAVGLNTSTDLGAVSYWEDRISGARWAQTTAGNQPRLQLTSAIKNTFPSVNFFDVNRRMTNAGIPVFNKVVAIVFKLASLSDVNTLISPASITNQIIIAGGTNAVATGIGVSSSTPSIRVLSNVENTNSNIAVFTQGGVIINGSIATTGSIFFAAAFVSLATIGTDTTTALQGEIGEILIYNRNLTNQQGVELCNNLNTKWAIY